MDELCKMCIRDRHNTSQFSVVYLNLNMLTANKKVNDIPKVVRHIEINRLDREKYDPGRGTCVGDCINYSPGHGLQLTC